MREEIIEKVVKTQEKITMYVAEDGRKFKDMDDCICYELKQKWDKWLEKFDVKEIESDTITFRFQKEYDGEIREFLKAYSEYCKWGKGGKIHPRYLENISLGALKYAEKEIDKKEFIDKEIYKFNVYYDEGDPDYEYGTYEVEFLGWEEELAKLQERIQEIEKIFGKKFVLNN